VDTLALNPRSCELVFPQGLYDRLRRHLFPGDHDEHGAIVAAGLARCDDGRVRLLARSVHLAQDGVDFVPGNRGYRMFRATYVRDRILECADDKLVYLNAHNHGGTDRVAFSQDDLASHERGYPALLDLAEGQPVGALVFAERAIAGDIWWPGGLRMTIDRTIVMGRRRTVLLPEPRKIISAAAAAYDRQTRIFGDAGQAILKGAKVGIIGVGGVGALLVEYLARLGVGQFVLIEPERIDHTNLARFSGATRLDALAWFFDGRWPAWLQSIALRFCARKIRIAKRIIRRANAHARIEAYATDFLEPESAARTLDCDYLFLAADSMRARLLFNAIVHQYLIPGVQVGAKVSADESTGEITGIHTISRPINAECGCLLCNGLINAAKLQDEGQTARELREQRYVDDDTVAAPSVITLNATVASQAANDFLFYMTGLTDPTANAGYLRFSPQTREAFYEEPRRSSECGECSGVVRSRLARGDLGRRLPTFYRS
jgi:molybdopterin/thiamine biosynthesis adenylyltransferase